MQAGRVSHTPRSEDGKVHSFPVAGCDSVLKQRGQGRPGVERERGQKRVGFIAQEIEATLPESFRHIVGQGTITRGKTEEGEPIEETIKTVDYARLVCVRWGVCKGLEKRVAILEAR